MKIALTLAAGLLAASSMAFAADNSGSKDNNGNPDTMNTGSIEKNGINKDGTIDDATKCREGTGGGAPCQEDGTVMDMQ